MSRRVPNKKIVVVMPAYHAVRTLERTFRAIPRDWVDEIILVDDASSDETANLARSLGITTIVHQKNKGYGGNQKTCYQEALARGGNIVVMVHPDFQYDPKYIPQLIAEIASGRGDACFGSRMILEGGARAGGMPWWKFISNIFLTKIENLILGLGLTEYHSGFRSYSRKALESLPIEALSDGFIFDSEIIVGLRLCGFGIREIPIETRYFKEASMVGFAKSVEYGFSILKLMLDFILFRAGFRADPRFRVALPFCPVCKSQRTFLTHPATILSVAHYTITEAARNKHFNIFVCRNCGSGFQPFPGGRRALLDFYTMQPEDTTYLQEEAGRRKSFVRVLRRINRITKKGKILDIGAGPGIFLDEARLRGWEVTGIELSEAAVGIAKNRYGIRIIEGALDALHVFPDHSFDAITAFDVIEHLEEPKELLQEAARLLTADGILVLTTPKFDSLLSRVLRSRWYAILPAHLFYFTNRGIEHLIEDSQFYLIKSHYFRRYFSLSYIFERVRGRPAGKKAGLVIPLQLFDEFELYLKKHS
ncbi:MAG: methyltransferase domain-containing protein [Candidatus Sungbacteria bacterium]|uniref:Methyltransferase domain-containing protein n=1 Tax=Candidatus Sungiibacteriota bacterium TaxID=2750080 RepID=A0A9D6LMS8_9BACT|nr:methyltransferase domain-containing protein [Candidatus Sungbacteria bacterium]